MKIKSTRLIQFFLSILFTANMLLGTSVAQIPWYNLVLYADFVGTVECTVAGGVVAKYKVLESFKGPQIGAEISIRIPPDMGGPTFPTALVGELYFITAKELESGILDRQVSANMVNPLWNRTLHADYQPWLFQGTWKLEELNMEDPVIFRYGTDGKRNQIFREDVKRILRMDEETLELFILKETLKNRTRGQHNLDSTRLSYYCKSDPNQIQDETDEMWKAHASIHSCKSQVELLEVIVDYFCLSKDYSGFMSNLQSEMVRGITEMFMFKAGGRQEIEFADYLKYLIVNNDSLEQRISGSILDGLERRKNNNGGNLFGLLMHYMRDGGVFCPHAEEILEMLIPFYDDTSDMDSLDKYKKALLKAIEKKAEDRELTYYGCFGEERLYLNDYDRRRDAVRDSLLHSETPFKFVNLLLEIADRDGDQYYHKMYGHILRDAGRETTLGFLDAITAEQFILGVEAYYEIHESVYKRVHKIKRDYTPPYIPPPPDEHDLETARMSFEINDSYMFDQSFGLLSKYDPAFVIDFLLTWENQDRRLPYKGYKLGSTFAMLCENNRENYFRELLTAKDPYLQVTGAVYLTLDGHQDGIIELQRLTSLEGDAGAWAALNLARRGDKIAVDRILEVFNNEGYDNINLHQRVMILLSNSAAASGLSTDQQPWKYKPVDPEQDRYPDECGDNRHCQKYLEWWELYKNDITLYDPWFEIFEAQKVD